VALSPDQSDLPVDESAAHRVPRYRLAGAAKGRLDKAEAGL